MRLKMVVPPWQKVITFFVASQLKIIMPPPLAKNAWIRPIF